MRLAIESFTGSEWMAGTVTIRDLLAALHTLGEQRPILELIEWWDSPEEGYTPYRPFIDGSLRLLFPKVRPNSTPPSTSAAARESLQTRIRRIVTASPQLPPLPSPPKHQDQMLRRLGVDCVFSVALEHRTDVSVPLMVWIYDLQHQHFPELVAQAELERRNHIIASEAARATRLIVKSNSVRDDLAAFLPQYQDKIRVMHFVSDIPAHVYETPPDFVMTKYDLPEKFIYLPNQFWQHKNHLGVIQALERLHSEGLYPVVVCTGSLSDHRNPDFIAQVREAVERAGLQKQFLILGSVPRDDVFALMRQSVVVLNPSIFEGFGLSTAEAKSLGKRTLLADLPPLREQDPPDAVYFDPNNPIELSERIQDIWLTRPPGPDLACESAARAALAKRKHEFAREFMEIAQEAVVAFHSQNEPAPAH